MIRIWNHPDHLWSPCVAFFME